MQLGSKKDIIALTQCFGACSLYEINGCQEWCRDGTCETSLTTGQTDTILEKSGAKRRMEAPKYCLNAWGAPKRQGTAAAAPTSEMRAKHSRIFAKTRAKCERKHSRKRERNTSENIRESAERLQVEATSESVDNYVKYFYYKLKVIL